MKMAGSFKNNYLSTIVHFYRIFNALIATFLLV
jgi:hypothetical protein